MKREVYIIGGGASLNDFPFHTLADKDTIAVNMAALDVPDPTYCITADSGIFRKLHKGLFKEIDTTWVLVTNPNHASMKWIDGRFVHKNGFIYNLFIPNMIIRNAGTDGIGFTFKDFRTGYNSGFCGLQLAVLLGYDVIHLLGFDLMARGTDSHYHDRYHGKKIMTETFKKFHTNFVLALGELKTKTDIEVISHSSISSLNTLIPYEPYKPSIIRQNKASSEPVGARNTGTCIISPKTAIEPLQTPQEPIQLTLSILVCSLTNRNNLLKRLISSLLDQNSKRIEILVAIDGGEITTGTKRNLLLENAKGDYIAFVDDDDLVSKDYVSKILQAIESRPDCVGIEGEITFQKKQITKKFIHSLSNKGKGWYEQDQIYYRPPNHLNPVKRKMAIQTGFKDITVGEDKDYSIRLNQYLKIEAYVPGTIYHYLTG